MTRWTCLGEGNITLFLQNGLPRSRFSLSQAFRLLGRRNDLWGGKTAKKKARNRLQSVLSRLLSQTKWSEENFKFECIFSKLETPFLIARDYAARKKKLTLCFSITKELLSHPCPLWRCFTEFPTHSNATKETEVRRLENVYRDKGKC